MARRSVPAVYFFVRLSHRSLADDSFSGWCWTEFGPDRLLASPEGRPGDCLQAFSSLICTRRLSLGWCFFALDAFFPGKISLKFPGC